MSKAQLIMSVRNLVIILACMFIPVILPARAQESGKAFSGEATATSAQSLNVKGQEIALWGVDSAAPLSTPLGVQGRAFLDEIIAGGAVRCFMMSETHARCLNGSERDLGLMLLNSGYVAVNRQQITGNDLAAAYLGAERQARSNHAGLWASDSAPIAGRAAEAAAASTFTQLSGGMPLWMILAILTGVPLLGLLILGIVLRSGQNQFIMLQRYQLAGTQKRERQLKEREKYVIASALENEIMTNRAKLDAFLVVYEELLKSLRDTGKQPKYQRAGDIIHDKPAMSRTVYDAQIDKLDVLGPQLAAEVSALYGMLTANPDYRTLEPEVPIEKAREVIDRIVRNAEKLIEPMDKVAGALSVIVRDKRALTGQ